MKNTVTVTSTLNLTWMPPGKTLYPDHQQIPLLYLRRTFLTSCKLHLMDKLNFPLCTLCSMKVAGVTEIVNFTTNSVLKLMCS